jgi:hypothetical protein
MQLQSTVYTVFWLARLILVLNLKRLYWCSDISFDFFKITFKYQETVCIAIIDNIDVSNLGI